MPRGPQTYSSPFGRLELSPEDVNSLEYISQVFVKNTIDDYTQFAESGKAINSNQWKYIKTQNGLHAYLERKEASRSWLRFQNRSGSSQSGSDYSENGTRKVRFTERIKQAMEPSPPSDNVPNFLVVGEVDGKLNDFMYGLSNPGVDDMRVKTSYAKDYLADCAVLESLKSPTPEKPFDSSEIKWVDKGQRLHLRALFKNRDFVYIESSGIKELQNGDKVGYHLLHSIHLPQTHELPDKIRGNMSICGIYKQTKENTVNAHIRAYLNPAGGLMRAAVVKSACDAILSSALYAKCGRMKKLAALLQLKHRKPMELIHDSAIMGSGGVSTRHVCVTCRKPAGQRFGARKGTERSCKLCFQYVCHKCLKKETFHYPSVRGMVLPKVLSFCEHCLQKAAMSGNTAAIVGDLIRAETGTCAVDACERSITESDMTSYCMDWDV